MPAAPPDPSTPVLLPGAHRVIRAIESHEGPIVGVLVTWGNARAVRVDAAALAGWAGWHFGGSEHVAGPLDIVRRAEGHDVLLPWCTERVSTFVGRRTAAREALSSGECSTLLVSLFRALEELGDEGAVEGVTGAWWLTDEGRPVFVLGDGEEARAGVALLVAQLGENCADKTLRRHLAAVQEGLRTNLEQQQRRVPRLLLEKWEGEVLDIAAPRALRREASAPEEAETSVSETLRGEAPPRSYRVARPTREVRASRNRTRERVRARTLAATVAAATGGVARWARRGTDVPRAQPDRGGRKQSTRLRGSAPSPRRRSLLVAAAAAIAVLLAGLLWPSGATSEVADGLRTPSAAPSADGGESSAADPSSGAERRGASADARPSQESSSSPVTSRPGSASEGPVEAASRLLKEIGRCADIGDAVCATAVAGGSAAVIEPLAETRADDSAMELIDEYGDAAVVRLTSKDAREGTDETDASGEKPSGAGQILVLVRINEKWLVRDVYDVADQPE